MTNSPLLGGQRAVHYASGKDVDALGPSDSSDSGSDVQGEHSLRGEGDHADELGSLIVNTASDSDSSGTGERGSATGRDDPEGADISPDQVIGLADIADDGEFNDLVADDGDDEVHTQKSARAAAPRHS